MTDRARALAPWALLLLLLCTAARLADPVAIKVQGPDTTGTPVPVLATTPSAVGSTQTQVTASNSAAAAAASASLAATVGKTNVLSGVYYSVGGATTSTTVTYTISGIQGGSISWQVIVLSGVNQEGVQAYISFNPPLVATGANTAITFADTSPGAGNAANSVVLWGFQQ